ncbi:MAG: hypothetical protein JXA28_01240 [Bacteroidetes bacterium]|nr:hypothetical protein [Bacteroidota bacterium]
MKKNIAIAIALLPLLAAGLHAQNVEEGMTEPLTMICRTSDGTVTISDKLVTIADYQLKFDSFISDGVVRFTDSDRNTVAVLDARGDEGLYLEILENETRMQVVAPRNLIRYHFGDRGDEPTAHAWSSVLNQLGNRKQEN